MESLDLASESKKRAFRRKTVVRRAEHSGETETRRNLGAMREELVHQRAVYALVYEKDDERVLGDRERRSGRGEEGARKAAARCGSQGTPKNMRVVARHVWRKGSAACLDRTKSGSAGIEAFVDWQRETSGGAETAQWRRAKKAWERPCRGVAQTERRTP